MSMNKTCPISNFTSDDCSGGMSSFLSQNSRFNEPIRIQDIALTDRHLVNVASHEFGEKVPQIHFESVAALANSRAGTIFSASPSKRGSTRSGSRNGSVRMYSRVFPLSSSKDFSKALNAASRSPRPRWISAKKYGST